MDKNNSNDEITIDLGRILRMLWHRLLIIVVVAVFCAALGYGYAKFFVNPTYSASADMLVNNSQDIGSSTTLSSSDLSASSYLVNTYSVILKSHTVLLEVIDRLGLDMSYSQLSSMISVSAVDSTTVMRITVKGGDPQQALDIVTCLVDMAPDVIIEAVEAGSVKTVDEPYTSGRPVAPNKTKYAAVTGVVGLVVICAFFIIQELMKNTFKTEEDLRSVLGLTVLGVIPAEDAQEKKRKKGGASPGRSAR